MTTILDGLNWGRTQVGKPYCTDWDKRFGPNCYDCSGFVERVLEHAGMPAGTLPTNSADMTRYLVAHPQYRLSQEQARNTAGAILLLGGVDGYGPKGHVGLSLGGGKTMESRGSKNGVGIYNFSDIKWTDFMIAPNVAYTVPQPTTPTPPNPEEMQDMMLMRGSKTPEVYLVSTTKTHITAEAYPFWLFILASRPGAVDPTTKKEWVVDEKMLACIPRTPGTV